METEEKIGGAPLPVGWDALHLAEPPNDLIRKTLTLSKSGEWIIASTPAEDRERDRVFPLGAQIDNYLRNPVLLWGHNYRDPWAIVGRAAEIQVGAGDIRIRVDLRPSANEHDPMEIVRLLWEGGFVRAASIGFRPLKVEENEAGGADFVEWELYEVSLVPVPANQEALRLAVKALAGGDEPGEPAREQPARAHDENEMGSTGDEPGEPTRASETDDNKLRAVLDSLEVAMQLTREVLR